MHHSGFLRGAAAAALGLVLASGCSAPGEGRSGGTGRPSGAAPSPGQGSSNGSGSGTAPASPGMTGSAPGSEAAAPAPGAAFAPPRDVLVLLPFDVRLNKLAALLDVSADDPALEPVRAVRFELGDYDFAQGVAPDLRWSAKRMGEWVKAVKAVCDSPRMKERFPSLRDDLEAFVPLAYGRAATGEDVKLYDAALMGASLAPADAYRVMCVGLLSSTEFVAQ
jgi:hypothetical protein